jgi:hypothetical protein
LSAEAHIKLVSVSVTVPSLLSMKRSLLEVNGKEKKIQKQTSIDEKKIFLLISVSNKEFISSDYQNL